MAIFYSIQKFVLKESPMCFIISKLIQNLLLNMENRLLLLYIVNTIAYDVQKKAL
jgi:hypothetical protein